ncbi:hypothetical protein M3649_21095 [Ureibacillus chungkukjangi]|uniref:YheC/YheD family protein n=1 Tax=Ureibacillus chungkukjangi TaxID=1202712 RepID=UPI002040F084|nr:YheC/YheD family protein [Ureibacillus chungkukjangi]MCM3390583.1 hypothetical protein [Ureibacillus chungkukjangi]
MHHQKNPNELSLLHAFTVQAKEKEIILIYFTPEMINQSKIHGFFYENGHWELRETDYPEVIYNLSFYSKKDMQLLQKLKETTPVINFPPIDWVDYYELLCDEAEFNQHLVPSLRIKTSGQFLRFLENYRRILLKPVETKPNLQLLFERKGDTFLVRHGKHLLEQNQEEVRTLVRNKIVMEDYYIQPYLLCKTLDGKEYNIRIKLQKNLKGMWIIQSIIPCLSQQVDLINISEYKALPIQIDDFLKQQFGKFHFQLKSQIKQFSNLLALKITQTNGVFLQTHEIEIVMVLDDLQNFWITDVTSPSLIHSMGNSDLEAVKNQISYALALINK